MLRSRVSCSIAVVLCLGTAAQGAAAEDEAVAPGYPVTAEFDIATDGDVIVLPVTVGQKTYPFLLDTGSTDTCVDKQLKNVFGDSVGEDVAETPGGRIAIRLVAPRTLQIGRIRVTPARPFLLTDLTFCRRVAGHEIYGKIGDDCLVERVMQIDFDRGKLRFLAKVPQTFPPGTNAVPLTWSENLGLPCVRATIGGMKPAAFHVDTGDNGSITVRREAMDLLAGSDYGRVVGSDDFFSIAGRKAVRFARVERFAIGPWRFSDIVANESGFDCIGTEFLSRFQVTFDFVNDVLYLTPGKKFLKRDLRDWSGIRMLLVDQKATVAETKDASPARAAGLRAGDVIRAIDGESANKYSLFQLRNMLKERDTVQLTIRRNDEDLSIRLDRPKEAAERRGAEVPSATRKR